MGMTFSELARMKAIRSQRTAELYEVAIKQWCQANGFQSPEQGVEKIKSQKEPVKAAIETINKLLFTLSDKKRAPKTIVGYVSATKKFLAYEDIPIAKEVFDAKVVLPQMYETSIDTIPTDDQMRQILLNANTVKAKSLITLLASSGLRINEACQLKVGNIDFNKHPVKISIPARTTKTRKGRETFISDEAAEFLKQYLGDRVKDPNGHVYSGEKGGPAYKGGLIDLVERAITKAGLRFKMETESARYAIHGHSFRKLFFSKCIGAGIDRGVCEAWLGHRFGLDSAYLRLTDEQRGEMYLKVMPALTFLSATPNNERLRTLEEENQELRAKVDTLTKMMTTITSELTMKGLLPQLETIRVRYPAGKVVSETPVYDSDGKAVHITPAEIEEIKKRRLSKA